MYLTRLAGAVIMACSAAACTVGPHYRAPAPDIPARFQAQLTQAQPGGQTPAGLARWWRQFDDPLVAELVEAAQLDHAGQAQSLARVMQARAMLASAGAARLAELGLNADARRERSAGAPGVSVPVRSSMGSVDASWEIDLFGARAKAAEAAGARVSLAAEVAATLVSERACLASEHILAQDLHSREVIARSSRDAMHSGHMARADGFLSDASAAAARERLIAQQAACDLEIKALVALTGVAEPALRARLGGGMQLPRPRAFKVEAVPAKALAQRPDIAAAERDLAAAMADINVAEAQRYPSLSLGGSIGIVRLGTGGAAGSADTWSFGPVLNVPLFDGQRCTANAALAQARYDEQAGVYRQRVRDAVHDIEQALVRLDAAARREADADSAARGYERYCQAGGEQFKAGASGFVELEEARRNSLGARLTHVGMQRDRVHAWIALYKALGGGWQHTADAPIPSVADSSSGRNLVLK